MRQFGTLLCFETKKILMRKSTWIMFTLTVLISMILNGFLLSDYMMYGSGIDLRDVNADQLYKGRDALVQKNVGLLFSYGRGA